jgi:hypothetical protein
VTVAKLSWSRPGQTRRTGRHAHWHWSVLGLGAPHAAARAAGRRVPSSVLGFETECCSHKRCAACFYLVIRIRLIFDKENELALQGPGVDGDCVTEAGCSIAIVVSALEVQPA